MLTGRVLRLWQCGHFCGTENVVHKYSISGALNLRLHAVHTKVVVPLNIIFLVLIKIYFYLHFEFIDFQNIIHCKIGEI